MCMAAGGGHADVVALLLDSKADVGKAHSYKDATPLILAAQHGHAEVINLLIPHGADASLALIGAVRNAQCEPCTVDCLHVTSVKMLMAAKADVNKTESDTGDFPLKCAAETPGRAELVKLLLENGADVQQRCEGSVPLTWAAAYNSELAATLLLAHGANVNPPVSAHGDNGQYTPLLAAADNGHVGLVNLLLRNGADANPPADGDGDTPLIFAAQLGHVDIVQLLLEWRADATQSKAGKTPLDLALENKHGGVVELLRALEL